MVLSCWAQSMDLRDLMDPKFVHRDPWIATRCMIYVFCVHDTNDIISL